MSNNTIACPICHKQLNLEYNICPYCGADLSPEEAFFGDTRNTQQVLTPPPQNIQPEAPIETPHEEYTHYDIAEETPGDTFNSNYDHYYDDVLPAVIKETSRISAENILKTGTIIIGTAAIIIYLIFML